MHAYAPRAQDAEELDLDIGALGLGEQLAPGVQKKKEESSALMKGPSEYEVQVWLPCAELTPPGWGASVLRACNPNLSRLPQGRGVGTETVSYTSDDRMHDLMAALLTCVST